MKIIQKMFSYLMVGLAASVLVFAAPVFAEEAEQTPIEPRTVEQTPIEPRSVEQTPIEPRTVEQTPIEPRSGTANTVPALPEPTFASESAEHSDNALVRFGKNYLLAGNDLESDFNARYLLFTFGNKLKLATSSEYNLIAGNIIDFSGSTKRDLFVAGNLVHIKPEAAIGRDIYGAGSEFTIEANLYGDVSIAANRVIIKDTVISGNVNLQAAHIELSGDVKIVGTLNYNDDAEISGLDTLQSGAVETYTSEKHRETAGEFWLGQLAGMLSVFFIAVLLLLLSPALGDRIAAEVENNTINSLGRNLLTGIVLLVLVPLLSLLCICSYFLAGAGIALFVAFILFAYIGNAFSGVWLGHLIVEKLVHSHLPKVAEALIGILIFGCLAMIPGINSLSVTFSMLLGLGLLVSCLRGKVCPSTQETPEPKQLENPFRGQKRGTRPTKDAPKVAAAKSTPKSDAAPKAASEKSDRPADKSAKSDKSTQVAKSEKSPSGDKK